jgi:hypothetical protein
MPWVGFESTIPVSERSIKFHALDRAATVIGNADNWNQIHQSQRMRKDTKNFLVPVVSRSPLNTRNAS